MYDNSKSKAPVHSSYKDKGKAKPFQAKGSNNASNNAKFPKRETQTHMLSQDSSEEEPLNNMIEVFQLSNADFQSSIDEVLAARQDKAPRTQGPITRGQVAKTTAAP